MKINEIIAIGWMLFATYSEVFLMILADLWSGVRKARLRGEARTSYAYKRTVDKIARYYNALIALTIMDIMQMSGIWYLSAYYDWSIPIFPLVTMIGALGISAIEIKSIYEKAEEKVKDNYKEVAALAIEIAKHKTDPKDIAKAVYEYMNNGMIKTDESK